MGVWVGSSLFQAIRYWGRRERKRHAKSWRDGKKEKGREPAPAFPSFLPFYFLACAFSIQRTRLSRSLEQARWGEEKILFFPACRARSRARVKARPNPRGKKKRLWTG